MKTVKIWMNHMSQKIKMSKCSLTKSKINLTGSKFSLKKNLWVSHKLFLSQSFMSLLTRQSTKKLSTLTAQETEELKVSRNIFSRCHWPILNSLPFLVLLVREMTITTLLLWSFLLHGFSSTLSWSCGSLTTSPSWLLQRNSVSFLCSFIHLESCWEISKSSAISQLLFKYSDKNCQIRKYHWLRVTLHRSSRWQDLPDSLGCFILIWWARKLFSTMRPLPSRFHCWLLWWSRSFLSWPRTSSRQEDLCSMQTCIRILYTF